MQNNYTRGGVVACMYFGWRTDSVMAEGMDGWNFEDRKVGIESTMMGSNC